MNISTEGEARLSPDRKGFGSDKDQNSGVKEKDEDKEEDEQEEDDYK